MSRPKNNARAQLRSMSQDTRQANAMKKRLSASRKTVSHTQPPNAPDDENEVERDIPKNVDRNMHCSNNLYRTLCVLCNTNERFLVTHYVNWHQETEVFIARISQTMVDAIRKQMQPFELVNNKIAGFCFFCEEPKVLSKNGWVNHILGHTGELLFVCKADGCNVKYKQKNDHLHCNHQLNKNVFDSSSNDGTLSGFMCSQCNYLQVNRLQIRNHLVKEHGFASHEAENYIESVTFVPNLAPIKSTIFNFDYIDQVRLSKCTICKRQCKSIDELDLHVKNSHGSIERYICHCHENLNLIDDSLRDRFVANHLLSHSSDLFVCLMCDNEHNGTFITENDLLAHISLEHFENEKVKFQMKNCDNTMKKTVSNVTLNKFLCAICSGEFSSIAEARNHSKAMHKDQMADFNVSVLKKTTEVNAKTIAKISFSANEKKYVLRQCLLCVKCDYKSTSKVDFLAHHNKMHGSSSLEINLMEAMLTLRDSSIESDNERDANLDYYSCYWCYENNVKFISGTVSDIHQHWSSEHPNPVAQPFQFYVEILSKCIHCDIVSTFNGLQEHTVKVHRKKLSSYANAIDSNQCEMCNFTGNTNKLRAHYKTAHQWIQDVYIINPNRLKPELIDKILAIDVHKKYQCDYCDTKFETKKSCEDHHKQKHLRKKPLINEIFDNSCCDTHIPCCNKLLKPCEYFQHLSHHSFNFSCPDCNLSFNQLCDAARHDSIVHRTESPFTSRTALLRRTLWKLFHRTKMIFGNGAVLYKCNLLDTTYDDAEIMTGFIELYRKRNEEDFSNMLESDSESSRDVN